MSADEFDQGIERLFNRAPNLPDAKDFNARLMGRLRNDTRSRSIVLSLAGLIGGVLAAKELIGVTFRASEGRFDAAVGDTSEVTGTAIADSGAAVHRLIESFGIGSLDMGSMTQTQSFLGVACVLITLLTVGAVKLYQQV